MSRRWKSFGFILALSLGSTIFVFGISWVVPQGERGVADWQVANMAPGPVDSSLVLVTARDPTSPAICGDSQWDLTVLESALRAFQEVGAAVIAPVITLSVPFAPECGGLSELVHLAETTRRIGSVIYPDSVPPSLAEAALALGNVTVTPDEDGIIRGVTDPPLSFGSSPPRPLGLTIASHISKSATPRPKNNYRQPRFVGGWADPPFSHYDFSEIWPLIQQKDHTSLAAMFRGKAVILFALGPAQPSLATPWETFVPVEYFHAVLTNAVLTNGWIKTPSRWVAMIVTGGVGILFAMGLLCQTSMARLGLMGLAGVLLSGLILLWGLRHGWVWPVLSTGLAWGMIAGGTIVWRARLSESDIQRRIIQGQQQVEHLERKLAEKLRDVRILEEHLQSVQHHATESATVIEGLQISQSRMIRQLEVTQAEMEDTRRQIARLQEELQCLRQQVPATRETVDLHSPFSESLALQEECASFQILTRDSSVLRIFQDLKKAAVVHSPLLLLGETGTGKEVFANAAHALSPRHRGPFISVNMAAIRSELFEGELFGHVKGAFTGAVGRKGHIEAAHGGTLFLDEVGDLPFDLQAKLLRFLEDGSFHRVGESRLTRVDVRIIAATNRELKKEVQAGRYREDLYYRLRSIVFTLPPLRQRTYEDRLLLAHSFLQDFCRQQQKTPLAFTQGALEAISKYPWPGNIRELRQTVAQAVALANDSPITESDLQLCPSPTSVSEGEGQGKEEWGRLEDSMVLECLRRYGFDMQATAKALGWDRSTVTQRLKGLGFQALVASQGNIEAAAQSLAGNESLRRVVEGRLREYAKNLLPSSKRFSSADEAVADCRKRFRNLPERHFPAVEQLVHQRFSSQ